jgi:histidinol-phosphate/aromatic aminotransferase/cobyric acid decarboxylase-like protein
MAFAQRAAVNGADLPKDMVWLNANENPLGPPAVSLTAMQQALPTSGRYHYQEFCISFCSESECKHEDKSAEFLSIQHFGLSDCVE